MRVAIKISYDGRLFHGFARQPKLKTVEGEIIKVLTKKGFIEDAVESRFRSASRTDKGVSAFGNVVAFNTNFQKEGVFQELKNELSDVIIYGIKEVDINFYPRYAKQRIYRYYLSNIDIDVDKILSVADVFTGEHDFSNFARVEEFRNPIRSIDNIVVVEQNNLLIIDFYAKTFLWNQIRRIVSALDKVGKGKLKKEHIVEALNKPNKKVDFGLATAEQLILKNVLYDFEFEYDNELKRKLSNLEKDIILSI